MPHSFLRSVLALAACLLTVASRCEADAPAERIDAVFGTPDRDYELQGEYLGFERAFGSSRSSRKVGLQVVALGDGNFQAVKYYGGLPGDGWFQGERFEYAGVRDDYGLVLRRGDSIIEISNGQARVQANDGRTQGTLEKVVRVSPTLGAPPPDGAIVLFGDDGVKGLRNAKVTEDGLLREGTETIESFGSFRLHVEYRLPYMPENQGQLRGNSGIYIHGRYEVQVLDSFGREGIENECGALYRTRRPDCNMCYPPLAWQTYDIDFTMPQFDETGRKTDDMRISLWHNGVLVHNNVAIANKTGGGLQEGAEPKPTKLQDHNDPVAYRNIWLLPKKDAEPASAGWVNQKLTAAPVPVHGGGSLSIGHGVISLLPACP